MQFVIVKNFKGLVEVIRKELGFEEAVDDLMRTHFWYDLKEDWVSALWNEDNTRKVLQGLKVDESWKGRYYHEDMSMGELEWLTIKRVA